MQMSTNTVVFVNHQKQGDDYPADTERLLRTCLSSGKYMNLVDITGTIPLTPNALNSLNLNVDPMEL
jgi:hypothetical protein